MRVNAKLEDKQFPEWIDWLMADNFFKKKKSPSWVFQEKNILQKQFRTSPDRKKTFDFISGLHSGSGN